MPGIGGSGGSCPPGALSPAIGDLAELSSLVFRHSCLAGDLPDSVTRLRKLTEIAMPDNNFSGPIPPGLFRLPALRYVDLSTLNAYLDDRGTLTRPERLVGLSGSLPDGPDAYTPSLEEVFLYGNALSGELPRALLRAPALRWLDLQSNNITGELPGEAGAYSRSITGLILRNNSLSGAIPVALAEMTALRKLDLGKNRLSGAVPAALRDSESLKALEDVLLDSNALTGPFCDALLPASKLWLGFNDLGSATRAGSSASASGGGGGEEKEDEGSLHGCVRGMDLSRNSLSGSLKAFTVIPDVWSKLDLSHNNFSGGIPEAFFSGRFSCVDLRFNELSGPLFDTRREDWSYDWDRLRVSDNSARMAGAVGAGYLPAPAPGVQASAAETEVLLAVRDALLGEAAGEAAGGIAEETAGGTAFADGGNGSWAEILRSWDASSSSACAWYGVGCTADGHVDTLHLIGASNVTLHPNFVPESPECEYDEFGGKSCAPDFPPPQVRLFLHSLHGGSASAGRASASGSLSEALGQLTHLTSLRISGHVLSGGLPPSLSRLSHLVALDLSSNRHLSGSIPPALFALPSLRELSLRGNNLTGEVLPSTTAAAAEVAPLSASLESLDVGENALSGSIPADVSLLTGMTRLALDQNRLDGSLPRELGALWMLTDLQLQGNALQGDVSALAAAFPPPAAAADNSAASSAPVLWGLLGLFPLLTRLNALQGDIAALAAALPPPAAAAADAGSSADPTASSAPVLWGLRGVFPLLTRLDVSSNQLSGDTAALFPLPQYLHTLNVSHYRLTWSPGNNAFWSADYMDLSHNRISAPLQRLFRSKDNLQSTVLRLSHNLLTGSILAMFNDVYSLETLDLSYNQLSGTIPDLGRSLITCVLSHNRLTGNVPPAPPAMEHLNVSWNQLGGIVRWHGPEGRGLKSLDASHNAMAGNLPALGNSDAVMSLTYLDLFYNAFTGTLAQRTYPFLEQVTGSPHFLESGCGVEVRLHHNKLTGSMPSFVFSSCLSLLDLSHNQLSGPIPDPSQGNSQSSSLVPLSYLDLSSNKLTGSISNALVTGLTALSHLDLSNNLLSGSLPSSLSRFTALHSLLAARNRISGSIPAGLASLTALQELDVSWSRLSGTIPALLRAAAPSLQVHLAGNALSGSVPPSLSDLPTSCFRPGNPKLCGKPLPDCKKRSSKPRKGRV
ncbi:unnamed protein product [Closterium sp. NIES-64]|nr:unnamed protein product [Closterium sp. NIES-64]